MLTVPTDQRLGLTIQSGNTASILSSLSKQLNKYKISILNAVCRQQTVPPSFIKPSQYTRRQKQNYVSEVNISQQEREEVLTYTYIQLQINNPFNSVLNTIIHVLGHLQATIPVGIHFARERHKGRLASHMRFFTKNTNSHQRETQSLHTHTYLGTFLSLLYFITCTAQLYLWINKWQTPSI